MHLHHHTFEVTRVGEKSTSGLMKDVINVMPMDSVAVDFIADNPGDTDGKQYIVIAAGGGRDPKSRSGGVYVAFA